VSLAVSFGLIDLSVEFVLEEGLSNLGIFPLHLSFVVFVGLVSQLLVLGVVEVLLLELFCLFLHGCHFFGGDGDIEFLFDLQEEGVFVIDVLAPQFLKFFDLQVLLVVFLCELIHRCAEASLEGLQFLLEIFRDDDLAGLLLQVVSVELPDPFHFPTAYDVGDAVGRVVHFPHHQSTVVFSHFRVQLLWGGQYYVLIERSVSLHGAIGLHGEPDIQFPVEDFRKDEAF
jgi:hypothetical protein